MSLCPRGHFHENLNFRPDLRYQGIPDHCGFSLTGRRDIAYKPPMRVFFVADLTPQGELRDLTEYDYESMESIPGAADVIARCSGELWKSPLEMEMPLSDSQETWLRWKATADSSGLATVRCEPGELVSLSVLASGKDLRSDATTFAVLQQHLVLKLKQTPFEPAFDLVQLPQRPLVATMTFTTHGPAAEQQLQALADRSFAAAYFRFLGLV
jgi:hypothetical protein